MVSFGVGNAFSCACKGFQTRWETPSLFSLPQEGWGTCLESLWRDSFFSWFYSTHCGQAMYAVSCCSNMFWVHYACCLCHFMCWTVMSLQWKESLSEVAEGNWTSWSISARRAGNSSSWLFCQLPAPPVALFLLYTVPFSDGLSSSSLLSAFHQFPIFYPNLSSPPLCSSALSTPLGSSAVGTWHSHHNENGSKKLWTDQFLCTMSNICDWQFLLFQLLSKLS